MVKIIALEIERLRVTNYCVSSKATLFAFMSLLYFFLILLFGNRLPKGLFNPFSYICAKSNIIGFLVELHTFEI